MSDNEKLYLESEEKNVKVTSSRVVLGDKNFVLRNISSVQVFTEKHRSLGIVCCAILVVIGLLFASAAPVYAIIFIGAGGLCLLFKDKYHVQVSSGGTPDNTIYSYTPDFPENVVEAINNALLDLDKGKNSQKGNEKSDNGTSAADEVMELKGLLDAGAITQEEFDAKKRELLGL